MEASICPGCDEPIPHDYFESSCEGCYIDYCMKCAKNVETFLYDGLPRCTFCFPTKPVIIQKRNLYEYALEKLGTTDENLRDDLLQNGPKRFRVAPNVFACTVHKNCASSACQSVAITQDIEDEKEEGVWIDDVRGYCCKALRKPLCMGCRHWEARPLVVVLIGMRRFRKSSLWAQLPRDVLITCIIKPFCWPSDTKN